MNQRYVCSAVSAAAAVGASLAMAMPLQAQTVTSSPTTQVGMATAPGVNITSTLYPRPPSQTITQPTTTAPSPSGAPIDNNAIGYPVDKFIWYPSITGAAYYDDNVFSSSNNRRSDRVGVVRPELAWRSNNWTNIEVIGSGYVEKRWYDTFSSENQLNGGFAAAGTLRAGENTQVVTRLQYVHAHEDRGTSDTITTAFNRPLAYDQLEAAAAINQRYDRLWTSVGAGAAFVKFSDGQIANFIIPQDYRTGAIGTIPFRVGYVVAPLTSVFVEVAANERNFRVNEFDSQGYRVVGGMLFEPGPGSRIKGEAFGGYIYQNYRGVGFDTISTFTYGGSMAFLLTPEVIAVLEGRRDAREASLSGGVFAGVPGDGVSVVESVVAGRIDWTVLPNLVIGGGASYIQDEFRSANRTDRALSPLASVKYFVDRRLTLGFDYRHLTFDSSGAGIPGFYKNVYLLTANWKL